MADIAGADVGQDVKPLPASSKTPEQRAAYNEKYRLIMQDRRDCLKEMKAIGYVGTIPEYKRYKSQISQDK